MATPATTNAVALHYNVESAWAETPSSPDMAQVRFTGESLAFAKQTATSETIRSDRMRDQVALTGWETSGDINVEVEFFDYDDFLAGMTFSNWVGAKTVTGTNIAATSTTITHGSTGFTNLPNNSYIWVSGFTAKSLNRRYRVTSSTTGAITTSPAPATTESAGATVTVSYSAAQVTMATTTLTIVVAGSTITFGGSTGFNPLTATNIVAGQWIYLSGFAVSANNGLKRVSSVSATTIVTTTALSAETCTNAQNIVITGRRLRNGTTQKSFHLQKGFTDIAQYMSMRGMVVSDASFEVMSGEVIKGTFSFMGERAVRAGSTAAASTVSTNTTRMMTAGANVGSVFQNGAAVPAGVKQLTFDVSNNLRAIEQIGSLYPYGMGYGFMDVTGQMEVYFENSTMIDQLINHTATELSFAMTDDNSNIYVVTFPSVLFTEGYPGAANGNDDVTIPLAWTAIRNATYDCQIQIDALPSLT